MCCYSIHLDHVRNSGFYLTPGLYTPGVKECIVISEKLLKYWYPNEQKNGTSIFYNWIRQHMNSQQKVLNIGAGPASKNPLRVFRGEVARVVGVDIAPIVLGNNELDESYVVDGTHLPFEENCFDIVFSDYVLEHVECPEPFLKDVLRVLKPGGSFFFRTPNKYHYVSLLALCTPHWYHELLSNRVRGLASDAHEPYPTFYRMNSKREIQTLANKVGFSRVILRAVECEPSYLMFSTIPFLVGVLYERITNKVELLSGIRANIFGRLVR
jgi:SAM-dependent methyltransferase